MKESEFSLALRETLSRSLGFELKPLERLEGATTLNYKATRVTDGFSFAVKCSPPQKRVGFEAMIRVVRALDGTKAVRMIFAEKPLRFRDYDILFLSWCEGVRLFPDCLTDVQAAALVDDYLAFSSALQRVKPLCIFVDYAKMRKKTLEMCCGRWARGLRRLLETELTEDRLVLRPELTQIIHGDLHHGNFLFQNGRVSGFFDFECITEGYPAEDFIRYFVCASEHLRWYNQYRKWRILRLFRIVVREAPYSFREWETAIDRLLVDKIFRKVANLGCGLPMVINLMFRARFYRKLLQVATEECAMKRT